MFANVRTHTPMCLILNIKKSCKNYRMSNGIIFHIGYTFNWCNTYKWKVSLNLGDKVLFFDLVACFLFLSARWGPIRFTSTKGLNIPVANCHFKLLAETTVTVDN